MRLARVLGMVLGLNVLGGSADGYALDDDRVTLYATGALTYDSNVFRLSGALDPKPFIGTSDRSDVIRTVGAGARVAIPVSRQQFEASANVYSVAYNQFRDLDYTGRDYGGIWHWQIGNDWNGNAGVRDSIKLAGFDNTQSRLRNLITVLERYLNGIYQLDSQTQLEAGASYNTARNGLESQRPNDTDEIAWTAGAKYFTPSGNSVGLKLRTARTQYPMMSPFPGAIDNGFQQTSLGPTFLWQITGNARVDAAVEYVYRQYDQVSQRNYRGFNGYLNYDWTLTGRSAVKFVLRQEVAGLQDLTTTYVLARTVGVYPRWAPTATTLVEARLDYIRRRYLGDTGIFIENNPNREDSIKSAGLSLTYQPNRNIQAVLSLSREQRTSNVTFADYSDSLISANVQLTF